ncbi:MAG: SPOR domain-containing protein [Proteobacteria bacterium]|nr:SPOR domain-containing protein [Pseudomonadota bacterium]
MKSSNLIIFLVLVVTSCVWQKNPTPKIRIVDLQGNVHPVATRVPELNAQALSSQGSAPARVEKMINEKKSSQQGEIKYQNYQDQNIANAQATSSFPQPNPTPAPESKVETKEVFLGATTKESEQVEYDLSQPSEEKKSEKSEKIEKKLSSKKPVLPSSGNKIFVQVGSFSNRLAADSLLKKMQKFNSGKIETIEAEKTIYRVLIGPFSTKAKAREVMKKITNSGQDAILTKGN